MAGGRRDRPGRCQERHLRPQGVVTTALSGFAPSILPERGNDLPSGIDDSFRQGARVAAGIV